jgi:hypothetical protein
LGTSGKENTVFPWKTRKLWYSLRHVIPCHEANQHHDAVVHYDYVPYYEDYYRFGRRGKQLAKLEKVSNPPPEANLAVGFLVSAPSRKPPADKQGASIMYPEHQEQSAAEGDLSPVELGVNFAKESSQSSVQATSQEVIVLKFGGTSLRGAERMRHAAGLVHEAARHSAVTVVVSAMKGITDQLLGIARLLEQGERQIARNEAQSVINLHLATLRDLQLPEHQHDRLRNEIKSLGRDLLHEVREHVRVVVDAALHDRLASFGERLSARLFAAALCQTGVASVPIASSDFVLTCDNFRDAKPQLERTCRRGRDILQPLLESGIVPVVTGFIGATQDGRITTLGRNSSDFSAAIIAYVVDAEELVIWTDVDGVYTANPKESAEARLLHEMSYEEARALVEAGADVLHPGVLPLASQSAMTVWVRNTFRPHLRGTRIGPAHSGGVA